MPTESRHQPDFEQFERVLRRRERPTHLPAYEHLASAGFIARATGTEFDRWPADHPDYWRVYTQFWLDLGYDEVPLEIGLRCPLPAVAHEADQVSSRSEERACIRSWADFEAYPWPDESAPIDFEPFEIVGSLLPDGAKIVGGVGAGPYEWASYMLGVMGLSLLLYDEPGLVEAVFEKLGSLHVAADRHLADMDCVGALRQGDDLGFRTSTFLKPHDLRRLVLPIYTRMAAAAHEAGKCFILHSCGNLAEVYDELIDVCRIDAKHSFEEAILPVEQFKARYGERVTPLGGLDVDMICRADEPTLRAYCRAKVDGCFADGFWAVGTGNSLTNYMPVENYRIVLDEARRYTA